MIAHITGLTMKSLPNKFQWGVLLGNVFDHYDTALYGLLTPFIAHQFFPTNVDPLTAIILAYALMPLGLISRPLGTMFFGTIGDILGGGKAFTLSLLGVAFVTILMAFLPTYNEVGFWSPILLSLSRMLLSFFSAAEISSGGVLLMENTRSEDKVMMSSLYNSSTVAGILLSSIAVTLLGRYGMVENGWRVLYLFGSITIFLVYFLRRNTPSKATLKKKTSPKDLMNTLWEHKKAIFIIAVISGFSHSCFSVAFVLINALLPYVSTLSKAKAMETNTLFMAVDILLLPLFGWLGSYVSNRILLIIGGLSVMALGIPLFAALEGANLPQALCVRFLLMLVGVSFSAAVLPWSQSLLPPSARFTATGLAYSLGSQLFGIPTTAVSLWIYQQTGMASSAGWYWVGLASISSGLVLWVSFREAVKKLESV